jgi:hypothetical protein
MARLSGSHRVKAREHDWMTFPIVSAEKSEKKASSLKAG